MVGEALEGLGGKALKSDILAKRIDFFKTLNEHVQLIGDIVNRAASVSGATQAATIYTVPKNKLFFWHLLAYENKNTGVDQNRDMSVGFDNGAPFFRFAAPPGLSENNMFVLSPMMILKVGQGLALAKNSNSAEHSANCHITGYEINKEILF